MAIATSAARVRVAIAISNAVAVDARAVLPGVQIEVIPNAVDLDRFAPGCDEGADLDRRAGLPVAPLGTVRAGLVATYARWKGHLTLLDAAAKLVADAPSLPVRWYVVGGPIYHTAAQFSERELRSAVDSRGLAGRIGFIPFADDPAPIYRALDIVIHGSTQPEPFGLTVAEAMACGRAVVVSAAGGVSELFMDGVDALGIEPGNADQLASAVRRLIEKPQLRVSLGTAARLHRGSAFRLLPVRPAADVTLPLARLPMNVPTRQIDSLTTVRGILAVWVVLYHFWNDLVRLIPLLSPLYPLARSGHLAVPGFFILSGFVLSYNYASRLASWSPRRVLGFWGLRLARIYPVHFVTLMAVAAMVGISDWLGFQLTDAGYSTRDFILNLLLMHTWVPDFRLNWNYPSWSISSEWFAYLVFPFAAAGLLPRLNTPGRAALFALVCLAGTAVVFSLTQFPFHELLIVIPTFFAGTAIFALIQNRTGAGSRRARWSPELLVGALVFACFIPGVPGTLLTVLSLFGLVLELAGLGDRPHRWWLSRPLVYLGDVSYSLYMTHTLAQKALYRLLPSTHFESSEVLVKLLVITAYILAVVGCCLSSYYLVERPSRRWFRDRFRERPFWPSSGMNSHLPGREAPVKLIPQ